MFSSAFKSFTSNITSNYDISKQPTTTVGVWTIFDAKKKSTGVQSSIFVFDRKSLEVTSSGFGSRTSATSIRKAQDEVIDRLKREASNLARLRHPSILQLVEPVEETRNGGLMFATEPVISSLSSALAQKDREDQMTRKHGRNQSNRNDENTDKSTADLELDELEIQKGSLQVAKGLEFLHNSAKLVHGNLNPETIFINTKSDWKISGLSFAGPPDDAEGHQTLPQISLSEALHHDPRVPSTVQLNLDYTSPDFVLDSNVNFGADIFSLGLILLACYRKPHASPIETQGNQSTYKRLYNNSSTIPSPSNNYLCSESLPSELSETLAKILTRRPAQRLTATDFQQSAYFDNILVNTMRFLDGFPAKTQAEKSQFMQGLSRVMPQFPKSVLGKKVLSTLLDEMKDHSLLSLILQNIFQILRVIPSSKEVVSHRFLPRTREIFLTKSKSEDRDTGKEAGLLVILDNLKLIAENCSAKQFKDDVLPIVQVAMESQTHTLTDAALQSLPVMLPLLDFSTVKHDLFPTVATLFSKTSSLSIKVRGLEALGALCGVSSEKAIGDIDDFSGKLEMTKPDNSISSLDKFTMQEKVVPLLKGIKTKEPAVMMAALKVLAQVGQVADIEFLAIHVMPVLWSFGLGPLLDLTQFKAYIDVIKSLSSKIEREQTRKLQEVSSSRPSESRNPTISSVALKNGVNRISEATVGEDVFEKLVLGNKAQERREVFAGVLSDGQRLTQNPPSFSWSSPNPTSNTFQTQKPSSLTALQPQPISRSITPDVISTFPPLKPSSLSSESVWGSTSVPINQQIRSPPSSIGQPGSMVSPLSSTTGAWKSQPPTGGNSTSGISSFPILPPPPPNNFGTTSWQQPNYNIAYNQNTLGGSMSVLQPSTTQQTPPLHPPQRPQLQQQKSGLDKYESLL